MKALIKVSVLLLMISAISGCGVAYNVNRNSLLKSATESDYGPPPPPNHQDLEAQAIRARLKDPESARFEFGVGEIRRDAIQSGFASPTPILVWRTVVQVNAKNSYGGYTGFQPWHFAWSNGRIIATSFSGEIWLYVQQ